MKITLTADQIVILFFLVVMAYGTGWLVVNKIIPWMITRRSRKERERRKNNDNKRDS